MYIFVPVLIVIVGYLLLVYADKQKKFNRHLGIFLAWFIMSVGFICFLCKGYSIVTHKGYHKYGKHHKCEYSKKHQYNQEDTKK